MYKCYMTEQDDDVLSCRECNEEFTVRKRRHHCRSCFGVFCESCMEKDVEMDGECLDWCCDGCAHFECPGDNVRNMIEAKLRQYHSVTSHKVTCQALSLQRGSRFFNPAVDSSKKTTQSLSEKSCDAPPCGYFEFVNKTGAFVALKLLVGLTNDDVESLWEIPRPRYLSVPPGEIVNAIFDPELPVLEVFILSGHPIPIPDDSIVVPDARGRAKVSPCASVQLYRQVSTFRIQSRRRNVLLKYKLGGVLEPRLGTSVARVGVFGKLMGAQKALASEAGDTIDFSSNITQAQIQPFLF